MFDFDDFDDFDTPEEPKTLEEGRYPARLSYVEGFEDTILWGFDILVWGAEEIEAETPNDFSAESEARDWFESVSGRSFDDEQRVELSNLEGRICEVELRKLFGTLSVISVYYSSDQRDPLIEEMAMRHEAYKALYDPELRKRRCEEIAKSPRWAEYLLERLRAGDKSCLFEPYETRS